MPKQIQYFKIQSSLNDIISLIFVIIAGLVLPAVLIPTVKFFGHTEIIEETAKALIVLFLILKFTPHRTEGSDSGLPTNKTKIIYGLFFGLLFGLSESIFYLNNIFQFGDFSVFLQRILWTVPMHIITVLVMVFSGLTAKRFLIFGFIGAVILHILFNSLIAY